MIDYLKNNLEKIKDKKEIEIYVLEFGKLKDYYILSADRFNSDFYIKNYELKELWEINNTYLDNKNLLDDCTDDYSFFIILDEIRDVVDLLDTDLNKNLSTTQYLNTTFSDIYKLTIATNITNIRHNNTDYEDIYSNYEVDNIDILRNEINNIIKHNLIKVIAKNNNITKEEKIKLYKAMQEMNNNNTYINYLLKLKIDELF